MKESPMERDSNFDSSGEALAENRNRTRENARSVEPVAVVGMACNFPGAPDIASFWRLLEEGGNSVLDGCRSRARTGLKTFSRTPRTCKMLAGTAPT